MATLRETRNKSAWTYAPDVRQMPPSTKDALIKEGMALGEDLLALPVDERPMVWSDLPEFEARHGRTTFDVIYDLGINLRVQYQRNIVAPLVVPFDLELLVRLYDLMPSSCAWNYPTLHEIFVLVYGQALDSFPQELRQRAQIAYGARFARMLGRNTTVQYRWLFDRTSSGRVGTTRRVRNIVSKIKEAAQAGMDARELLESLAVPMWMRRGLDINAAAPAPDPIALARRKGGRFSAGLHARALSEGALHPEYAGGAFACVD